MKKKVLILVNHEVVIYNFRKELVDKLLSENYDVIISSPKGVKIQELIDIGCQHSEVLINRHGLNPLQDIKLIRYYIKLIKEVDPQIVLSYTIKPNIYGALASMICNKRQMVNITGLGSAVESKSILQKIIVSLYRFSFRRIDKIYFQNNENMQFFKERNICVDKHHLLPGSGVNLQKFNYLNYPSNDSIHFVFISRIMKEKGIEEYINAARIIRKRHNNVFFHVCGFHDDRYVEIIESLHDEGIIIYHGMLSNVRDILKVTHCTIHPSYYPEGMSNVLLESAASGRPVITTGRSGCRETVEDGISGYIFEEKNTSSLVDTIENFLNLTHDEKIKMGINGRTKMEKEFDRNIVVNTYMNHIESMT